MKYRNKSISREKFTILNFSYNHLLNFCLHFHSTVCLLFFSGKVKGIEEDQMIIDAGQKLFGPKTCAVCNTVYHPGNKEDEDAHKIKHDEVC